MHGAAAVLILSLLGATPGAPILTQVLQVIPNILQGVTQIVQVLPQVQVGQTRAYARGTLRETGAPRARKAPQLPLPRPRPRGQR
jgi:hypothetical protein